MDGISPRQLALALGASESSLKRWCDQGLLVATKTAGGHRRVRLDSVVDFLRRTSRVPARPELLGLPAALPRAGASLAALVAPFRAALVAGDEEGCRQMALQVYLSGQSASALCDEVMAPAMRGIGDGWSCGDVQVYQERRACDLCQRVLSELRSLLPRAVDGALWAIGGTPQCDPYTLPTAMVEVVLRQAGWNAQSLGSRLPFDTLLAAIDHLRPRVFWLSVSHVEQADEFVRQYADFHAQVPAEVAVVVGGRALTDQVRRQMRFAAYCDDLAHLESFVQALVVAPNRRIASRRPARAARGRRPSGGSAGSK